MDNNLKAKDQIPTTSVIYFPKNDSQILNDIILSKKVGGLYILERIILALSEVGMARFIIVSPENVDIKEAVSNSKRLQNLNIEFIRKYYSISDCP